MSDDARRTLLSLMCVGAVGAAMIIPFYHQWGGMEDEAVTVLGAREIVEGRLPYRDFDTHHTPGSYFITALFLWLLRDPQLVARGLACACGGLLCAALFLLLRVGMKLPERWSLWACCLCACTGVTQWPILNYHWFGIIAAMYGAACLVMWGCGWRRGGWLAGVFCALTIWMTQNEGASIGLASCAVAALCCYRRPRYVVEFLLSVGLTSLLLWIPIAAQVGVAAIWKGNVESVFRHGPFGGSPYTWKWVIEPTSAFLQAAKSAPWTPQTMLWAVHALSYLFVWWIKYGFFWIWLGLWLLTRPWSRPPARALLGILGGFLALSLYRQDMLYLNYISPLLYAALADTLGYCERWRRAAAGFAAIVAAGFLVQYGGLVLDVQASRFPIAAPGGLYYTDSLEIAQDLAAVRQWWQGTRPDHGTVFAYPFRPALYSLFVLKPATRYFMIFPLNYSQEDFDDAMADLRRRQPEWILRTPLSDAIFKDLPKVPPDVFRAESRRQDEQVLAGYVLVRDGLTQIWHRGPWQP